MARRLKISPEGVGELRDAHIDPPVAAGRNGVVVYNDHPDVASDETYTNIE